MGDSITQETCQYVFRGMNRRYVWARLLHKERISCLTQVEAQSPPRPFCALLAARPSATNYSLVYILGIRLSLHPIHSIVIHTFIQNGVQRPIGSPKIILTVFKSPSTSHSRFRASTKSRSRGLSFLHFNCKPYQPPQRHTYSIHFKTWLHFRIL